MLHVDDAERAGGAEDQRSQVRAGERYLRRSLPQDAKRLLRVRVAPQQEARQHDEREQRDRRDQAQPHPDRDAAFGPHAQVVPWPAQ